MTEAKLYLPREADNYHDALQHVEHTFCSEYGGCTRYKGRGSWIDGDGALVGEPVSVIETVTDSIDDYTKVRRTARALARDVKDKTGEEAVMVVVDGEKLLV